ncbi:CsbD family protein [Teichococcus vastitatis]|uniref:CsbD family protein n=1 Tax=Teichococcus vastitatis TaxID=2307076 RepID=A0ABS9W3K9_9PROT|nr:CsbD family protein [Pseudoroseomonas vastitatis]MCI0753877.1 CsbD family protein [Pseudoroseomonas vastitatis]
MVDKDRMEGKTEQAKGSLKKGAGEIMGDEKIKAEGQADKAKGKVQDTYGAAKDKVRDAADKT